MTRSALLRDFAGFMIAVFAAAMLLAAEPAPTVPPASVLASVAVIGAWVAWQDLADFTIPDGAVAGLALIGLVHRLVAGWAVGLPPTDVLQLVGFDALLAGGGLWVVREVYFRRRGFDGLGLGDVKLAAAGAILVGSVGFSLALGAACLGALALAWVRRPADAPLATFRIAFGAVLGPAIALVFFAAAGGLLPGPLD
jgi:leader peptidase (prepilin peptidase)/N-methyltransferase